MTNNVRQNQSLENNAKLFAEAYLEGFRSAIQKFYKAQIDEIDKLGFPVPGLAIYKKSLKEVTLKIFV